MNARKIRKILTLIIVSTVTLWFNANAANDDNHDNLLTCYAVPMPEMQDIDAPIINFLAEPSKLATIRLERMSTCRAGFFNSKGAEIVAHDPKTQRLFVVNQATDIANGSPTLDVLDISDPYAPSPLFSIDLSFAFDVTVLPTSVAVKREIVAVAVHPADSSTAPGKILFYDVDGNYLNEVEVGYEPDMVIFTPNGQKVLAANSGLLPTMGGSVSLIDITRGVKRARVTNADFSRFNADRDTLIAAGVRLLPETLPEILPETRVSQSLSPEFVAVSHNSLTAWVTLEVNNAFAVVDIKKGKVSKILPLGVKDHSHAVNGFVNYNGRKGSNALDASDRDDGINIINWPVFGMYQPDAIAAYHTWDRTYLVTANEGSHFGFDDFDERERVEKLKLDPGVFPDADELKMDANLGRLRVTTLQGDIDNDGKYEALYAFGARSFSIWSGDGRLVFDSGDDFEQITAKALSLKTGSFFNSDDNANEFDSKSDDQGPEPDGVTIGKLDGRYYAFVVLVRPGGVMVYDITNPRQPRFQQYINNRNFNIDIEENCGDNGSPESELCAQVGDLGPEGVLFISQADSPIKVPLLVIANQTSSSTTLYRINRIGKIKRHRSRR